jgi:hypothetical protein
MLYRAAANDSKHVIRFGLATSRGGFKSKRAGAKPDKSQSGALGENLTLSGLLMPAVNLENNYE